MSSQGTQPVVSEAEIDGFQALEAEQMFRLIDSTLSFEACLYHQVLPIALKESRLKLGMVNPEDTAALDYVRRILSYMNYSVVSQPLAATAHQALLSAYLNYMGTVRPSKSVGARSAGQQAVESAVEQVEEPSRTGQNSQATFILSPTAAVSFLPDPAGAEMSLPNELSTPPTPTETPQNRCRQLNSQLVQTLASKVASSPHRNLPVLEVQATGGSSDVDALAVLPPKDLLQELLARVLAEGIGRLYFERQSPKIGRILWSQNGVLQSVLEELPLPIFQGVINELKLMTNLSLIPVEEPRQVEIERLYQQNRLLLRLRLIPGAYGEEATLQVLRGAALKFFQQQQLAHLGRDALVIAQQLQRKLDEMRQRVYLDPDLTAGKLEALPALHQLIESVDQQLEALDQMQS